MTLFVLAGLPGSGKSTHAAGLAAAPDTVLVSMDDAVRARGLSLVDYDARLALQPDIEASIPMLLASGFNVIAEFGSWSREERDRLRGLAEGGRVELHFVDAPVAVCAARVRARGGPDAEALARDVVEAMGDTFERPTEDEAAEYAAYIEVTTG